MYVRMCIGLLYTDRWDGYIDGSLDTWMDGSMDGSMDGWRQNRHCITACKLSLPTQARLMR